MFALYFICLIFLSEMQMARGQMDIYVKASTRFALSILKYGDSMGNKLFAPMGISMSMGPLYAGSSGETKLQIGRGLFNNLSSKDLNNVMNSFRYLTKYNPSPYYNLTIAIRMYVQNKSQIVKQYRDDMLTYYKCEIKSVDFDKDSELVRKEINEYARNETKTTDLISENSLKHAKLVFVKTTYFKDTWKNKFNVSNTSKKEFFTSANETNVVDMMTQNNAEFYYYEDDVVKVLGLPFANEKERPMTMYVLMPTERFGLDRLVSAMTVETFQNSLTAGRKRIVQQVDLPKFKWEYELNTTDVFRNLGIVDMYDPKKADFSGIDGSKDLYVSEVTHKLTVEVNEDGSEAAFGGSVSAANRRALPVEFLANEPFLFCFVNPTILNVHFMGRFVGKP